jgi:hypothetical protein
MWPMATEPPKTIEPKKAIGPPFACIARRTHGETWCGRSYGTDEFFFQDADYAVAHYSVTKGFHACVDCVAVVKRVRAEEEGKR